MEERDIIYITEPKLTVWQKSTVLAMVAGFWTTLRHLFMRKITLQYPEEERKLYVDNQRGIHRLNRDLQGRVKCVACLMCETICPAHCINITPAAAPWPDREKYPETFTIDELRCIYCGMCEQSCPVDAIQLTQVFEPVSYTREQMLYTKEMLLEMADVTEKEKPDPHPKITDYPQ